MNLGQSITVGVFAGIPVKLHWSFALIIPFIAFQTAASGYALDNVIWFSVFVLSIFGSVLLHEYGHALTARRYNVNTQDIIISPIGGVARLERFPEKPIEEFVITIAGPLVNIAIAVVLAIILYIVSGQLMPTSDDFSQINTGVEFMRFAFMTNIALFVFNLIPAFPMDGGRILRSLSSMVFDRSKSTKIAAIVGRVIAVLFVILGIYFGSVTLPLIGIFIFMSAGKELEMLDVEQTLSTTVNRDILRTEYTKLHIGDDISRAVDIYESGTEKNFLVYDSLGYVVGALPELFIQKAIHDKQEDVRLGQYLSQSAGRVEASNSVLSTFNYMKNENVTIAEVLEDDVVIGVVDRNIVSQVMEVGQK